jgi:hypothetical protein
VTWWQAILLMLAILGAVNAHLWIQSKLLMRQTTDLARALTELGKVILIPNSFNEPELPSDSSEQMFVPRMPWEDDQGS